MDDSEEHASSFFNPELGGIIFLENAGVHLPDHTVSYAKNHKVPRLRPLVLLLRARWK
jgi:hypothetical protein